MKKILITMSGSYPYGTAYATRMRAFTSLLKNIGYEVLVLCDFVSKKEDFEKNISGNVKIYSLEKKYTALEKYTILPREYVNKMKEIIKDEKPSLILSSSMYNKFFLILKEIKKEKIPIVLESCEWYNPNTFKYGILSHHYLCFLFNWNFIFPKVDGVIAISTLIEKRYKKYLKNVIRIPSILNFDSIKAELQIKKTNRIRLLFAGSIARTKDKVFPFIKAFEFLEEKQNNFEICICGIDENELKHHIGIKLYEKYKNKIICKGKLSQEVILDEYKKSHFGIFMRPIQRSSNAGFSTKLGEGMSVGTPFIVNDTSDISLYLKNEKNGFIVEDDSYKISELYKKILEMSEEKYIAMRKDARRTAEIYFNEKYYEENLKKFLENILNKENRIIDARRK